MAISKERERKNKALSEYLQKEFDKGLEQVASPKKTFFESWRPKNLFGKAGSKNREIGRSGKRVESQEALDAQAKEDAENAIITALNVARLIDNLDLVRFIDELSERLRSLSMLEAYERDKNFAENLPISRSELEVVEETFADAYQNIEAAIDTAINRAVQKELEIRQNDSDYLPTQSAPEQRESTTVEPAEHEKEKPKDNADTMEAERAAESQPRIGGMLRGSSFFQRKKASQQDEYVSVGSDTHANAAQNAGMEIRHMTEKTSSTTTPAHPPRMQMLPPNVTTQFLREVNQKRQEGAFGAEHVLTQEKIDALIRKVGNSYNLFGTIHEATGQEGRMKRSLKELSVNASNVLFPALEELAAALEQANGSDLESYSRTQYANIQGALMSLEHHFSDANEEIFAENEAIQAQYAERIDTLEAIGANTENIKQQLKQQLVEPIVPPASIRKLLGMPTDLEQEFETGSLPARERSRSEERSFSDIEDENESHLGLYGDPMNTSNRNMVDCIKEACLERAYNVDNKKNKISKVVKGRNVEVCRVKEPSESQERGTGDVVPLAEVKFKNYYESVKAQALGAKAFCKAIPPETAKDIRCVEIDLKTISKADHFTDVFLAINEEFNEDYAENAAYETSAADSFRNSVSFKRTPKLDAVIEAFKNEDYESKFIKRLKKQGREAEVPSLIQARREFIKHLDNTYFTYEPPTEHKKRRFGW